MLLHRHEEDDRGGYGHDTVGDEHAGDLKLVGKDRGQHQPARHADVHRQRSQPRGGRPLPEREPARGHLGHRVVDEGLPDGDPDLRHQHQGVALSHQAAHQPEDACQRGAYPHADADPIRVNGP